MVEIKCNNNPKIITDLRHLVKSSAELYGDRTFYTYKEGKEIKTLSFKDTYDRMNAIGTAMSALGIMGTHIAVIGDTHPSYMTTFFATVNGGGVIVPLDKDLKDEDIIAFMNVAEVTAVFYTESFNKRIIKYSDQIPTLKYCVPIIAETEDCDGEKVRSFDSLLELGRKELENGNTSFLDYEIVLDKLCAILFTSGTTGTSKGVMLSHRNFTAATNAACQAMKQYGPDSYFVDALPMHHSYEITCGQLAIFNIGSQMFINDSIKNVMRNFQTYKPNSEMLVPLYVETMHKRIWSEIEKKGMTKKVKFAIKLSNALLKVGIDLRDKLFAQIRGPLGGELRSIVCGGAPVNPQLIKDFRAFGILVIEGYGITECSPLVAVNPPNKIKYHSVGRPVDCCQVKIDKKDGEETGEILVKGENVMMGYYNNEEATREVMTEDGWFRTGDIGYMDKDNYIYITGRKKNVIILSNGKNVFPEEIEERLKMFDIIGESVVLARNADGGDPRITALIYPNQELVAGKSKEEIEAMVKEAITELNRQLPVYKQIRDVEVRETEFEKTTSRKIKRHVLK